MEIMKERTIQLLTEHKFAELRALLAELNSADLAVTLSEIPENLLPAVFRLLPKDLAADTFIEMDSDMQETLLRVFTDPELEWVMAELFIDDTVDIIEEMPATIVRRLLKSVPKEKRDIINEVLNYPSESAGSYMTVEYISLKENMTVSEAFAKIRSEGVNKETIYTCYVTDRSRIVMGTVSARELMLASPDDKVGDLMERNVISCFTSDKAEDVARMIEKYDLLAIPVTDAEKRIVGIITFDDAMDIIREQTDDTIMKMAAVEPLEEGYFKTPTFTHARKRLLWLLVLMVSATGTGLIITAYENAMTAIMVSFIPMLMGTGGNSGSQSSAIIIRGLATGELTLKDFGRVIFKEFRIALIAGVALALANAVRILLLNQFYYHIPGGMTTEMIVVGVTLICAVVTAKTLGCMLPMLAKRLGLDPALIASPVLTTLVDAGTVLIYFSIASGFGM